MTNEIRPSRPWNPSDHELAACGPPRPGRRMVCIWVRAQQTLRLKRQPLCLRLWPAGTALSAPEQHGHNPWQAPVVMSLHMGCAWLRLWAVLLPFFAPSLSF